MMLQRTKQGGIVGSGWGDLSVEVVLPTVRSKQEVQKVAKKSRNQTVSDLWMAGAEGIEPSARGFGVDVEKLLHRYTSRPFQPLADFYWFALLRFDAFLMLFAYETRFPTRIRHGHKRYGARRLGYSKSAPGNTKIRNHNYNVRQKYMLLVVDFLTIFRYNVNIQKAAGRNAL